jgi:hypothetical protein
MRKLISIILIAGFLFVDFLLFHDIFKPGESTPISQWLTGILSIPVIVLSVQSLYGHKNSIGQPK